MKKERKPVAVVEEAPYEGPTIFDKVPPSQDSWIHLKISRFHIYFPNKGFQDEEEGQELNGGEGCRGGGRLEKIEGELLTLNVIDADVVSKKTQQQSLKIFTYFILLQQQKTCTGKVYHMWHLVTTSHLYLE